MRRMRSVQIPGVEVQEILDEINERASEFGITSESDIISVSAMPATHNIPLLLKGKTVEPTVEVVVVYWDNR